MEKRVYVKPMVEVIAIDTAGYMLALSVTYNSGTNNNSIVQGNPTELEDWGDDE